MVRVGVVGCAHGKFDEIYAHIDQYNQQVSSDATVELLLCCGDVQCLRNTNDLECEACPKKYRHMNAFHEYYSGTKRASILTILIGGNHEASNYFQELHYGGWVAPNMFYLGAASVINVMGLRIAGFSGIYDPKDYKKGHYESVPYSKRAQVSVFHTREMQVFQLSHLSSLHHLHGGGKGIDIMMSHDWPRKIEDYGDKDALFKRRPDFKKSIEVDNFGSVAGERLLHTLQPKHWFAGHMHVPFQATVVHSDEKTTQFMALDKCHATRPWFDVVDVAPSCPPPRPAPSPSSLPRGADGEEDETPRVMMDVQWLAILRATHHVLSRRPNEIQMPTELIQIRQSDLAWIERCLDEELLDLNGQRAKGEWVMDFTMTAPSYGHEEQLWTDGSLGNPQTDALLELLELSHVVTSPFFSNDDDSDDGDETSDDEQQQQHDRGKRSRANDDFLESLEAFTMEAFQF